MRVLSFVWMMLFITTTDTVVLHIKIIYETVDILFKCNPKKFLGFLTNRLLAIKELFPSCCMTRLMIFIRINLTQLMLSANKENFFEIVVKIHFDTPRE